MKKKGLSWWKMFTLSGQLRAHSEGVREQAARELGQTKDPRAVSPLMNALQDKSLIVRRSAALALGQIGDAKAVEPLLQALQDEKISVRKAALIALGGVGDVRTIRPLVDAMHDLDPEVRQSASKSLIQLGAPAVDKLIPLLRDSEEFVRKEAAATLGKIGDARAVQHLLKVMTEDEADRPLAAKALEALKWHPTNPEEQIIYAFSLGKFDDPIAIGPPAVPALINLLRGKSKDFRVAAARALGQIGDKNAADSLLSVLQDERSEVREEAARALGLIGDAKAVAALMDLMQDQEYHVRPVAAKSLGQIGDPACIDALALALSDKKYTVRKAAASALISFGELAIEPLLEATFSEDHHTRLVAIEALGQLGDQRVIGQLVAALRDKNEQVRKEAARSLGNLGDPRAVEPLVGSFNEQNPEVWEVAAHAVIQIDAVQALPIFWEYLATGHQSSEAVAVAIKGLLQATPAAVANEWLERLVGLPNTVHIVTIHEFQGESRTQRHDVDCSGLKELAQYELSRRITRAH